MPTWRRAPHGRRTLIMSPVGENRLHLKKMFMHVWRFSLSWSLKCLFTGRGARFWHWPDHLSPGLRSQARTWRIQLVRSLSRPKCTDSSGIFEPPRLYSAEPQKSPPSWPQESVRPTAASPCRGWQKATTQWEWSMKIKLRINCCIWVDFLMADDNI